VQLAVRKMGIDYEVAVSNLSPFGSGTKVACLCRSYSYHHTLAMLRNKKLKKLIACPTVYHIIGNPTTTTFCLHFAMYYPCAWDKTDRRTWGLYMVPLLGF